MNDRYLYRAKRTDNGEWVVGFYHWTNWRNTQTKEIVEVTHSILPIDCQDSYHVDPSTICQCTGKNDVDGKLIFEHDIVAFLDTYSTENGWSEQNCIGEVCWDDETLSFQVTERLSAESYEVLEECKVIGNIFDNPELLKEGENHE